MVGGENRIENALSLSASKNQILINPDIYHYVSIHDSEDRAKYLLDKIETTRSSLKEFPEKGICRLSWNGLAFISTERFISSRIESYMKSANAAYLFIVYWTGGDLFRKCWSGGF
jgi:hypothetical protein